MDAGSYLVDATTHRRGRPRSKTVKDAGLANSRPRAGRDDGRALGSPRVRFFNTGYVHVGALSFAQGLPFRAGPQRKRTLLTVPSNAVIRRVATICAFGHCRAGRHVQVRRSMTSFPFALPDIAFHISTESSPSPHGTFLMGLLEKIRGELIDHQWTEPRQTVLYRFPRLGNEIQKRRLTVREGRPLSSSAASSPSYPPGLHT